MTFNESLQSLKFKRDKRYALVGDEPYLKDLFVSAAEAFNKDMMFQKFWPDQEEEAVGVLGSGNLFQDQFVILYGVDRSKAEKFLDPLSQYGGNAVLIFQDDVDLRSREITEILGKCQRVECHKLKDYGGYYPAWITERFREAGYEFEDGVPEAVYGRVGGDLYALSNEIKKLFIYKDETKKITLDDVRRAISLTARKTSYDILEAMLKRELPPILSCMDSYSKVQGDYIELISFLGHYLEKMYRMLLLRDRKHSPDDIAEITGLPKYYVNMKYLPKAVALGKGFFVKQIGILCELDAAIRLYKGDPKVLMEQFFINFIR